jgi:hypothetical protein
MDLPPLVGRGICSIALFRQREAGRTEAEDVHEQGLVVALPMVRDEAILGAPAMGERRPTVQGPAPVRSTKELVGQTSDLRLLLAVAVEVGRTGEHAREEEGGIDGRQLAVPHAPTGLHVEEVIVEALVAGRIRLGSVRAVAEESESSEGDRWREFPCDHASLDEDRKGGQRQPDRRDAGRCALLGLVADETVLWVGLVEVVLQRGQLEPIQVLVGQDVDGVVLGHQLGTAAPAPLPIAVVCESVARAIRSRDRSHGTRGAGRLALGSASMRGNATRRPGASQPFLMAGARANARVSLPVHSRRDDEAPRHRSRPRHMQADRHDHPRRR